MLEKGLLTRTYSARDQVPDYLDFTRAKNNLPSWDKYFNGTVTKVIKSFVPELRSRKVFHAFRFPMSISHIRISGYVTVLSNPKQGPVTSHFLSILLCGQAGQ